MVDFGSLLLVKHISSTFRSFGFLFTLCREGRLSPWGGVTVKKRPFVVEVCTLWFTVSPLALRNSGSLCVYSLTFQCCGVLPRYTSISGWLGAALDYVGRLLDPLGQFAWGELGALQTGQEADPG